MIPNQINTPSKLGLLDRLKFLAKDSALYGTANAINKLVTILVFPILVRYFSVEAFGIIDSIFILSNLFVILFVFGQDSAVARYYYENEEISYRKQVISQSLIFQLILLFFSMPLLWLYVDSLSILYTGSNNYSQIISLIIFQIPFGIAINFSANILKWTFQRKLFLIITLGSTLSYLLATVILVTIYSPSMYNIFQIFFISRFIFSVIGFSFILKYLTTPKDFKILKSLLSYALPYGIICSIGAFLPALDRYFIINRIDLFQLGIYAVGYKISNLITLPVTAFQTAWGPFYLSIFKEKDSSETFNEVLFLFSALICILILCITFIAEPIIKFLATDEYIASTNIVFPLSIGIGISAIGSIATIGIDLSKKTSPKIISLVVKIVSQISIILLLIKPLGIVGVAIGVLSGRVFHTLTDLYFAYKQYSLRFNFKRILILLGLTASIAVINILISTSYEIQFIILFRLLSLILFILLLIPSVKDGMELAKR